MKYSRFSIVVLVAAALAGCATSSTGVGSQTWHGMRMQEIQQAYDDGEIDTKTYIELKNDTDKTRLEYQQGLDDRRYRSNYYYGPFYDPFHYRYRYRYRH